LRWDLHIEDVRTILDICVKFQIHFFLTP
jgi:hypothetical protein